MERAAVQVDIATVRLVADRSHIGASFAEERRSEGRCGAIPAIHHDPEAIQPASQRAQQEIKVTTDVVGYLQLGRLFGWVRFFKNSEDLFFDLMFFRVRQL